MTSADNPTLDELRAAFGPGRAEARMPPTPTELAGLHQVIPGIAVGSDRIVIPLLASARENDWSLLVKILAICSAAAIVVSGAVTSVRPALPWYLIHSAWFLPLLLLAAYRARVRQELLIFPSSMRCQVRQGTLLVDTCHRSLFVADSDRLGLTLHLGLRLVGKVQGSAEQLAAAAKILDRYILFASPTAQPADSTRPRPLPGPLACELLDRFLASEVGDDRMVLRVLPYGLSELIAGVLLGVWIYLLGPLLCVFAAPMTLLGHMGSLALTTLAMLGYWWEQRPRLVTLLAGRRAVLLRQRSGAEETVALTTNPFFYEGLEGRSTLRFVRPAASPGGRQKAYPLVDIPGEDDLFDDEIDALGEFLGLPPRPPEWRNGGRGALAVAADAAAIHHDAGGRS
jgi:hypothetical protein